MKRPASIDSKSGNKITVLLADDHGAFRKSLKLLIEQEGDMEVVGEAKSGREAVRLTLSLHPKVVIMDIAMPLLNGLEATRQILETSSGTRVLILSAHLDSEYIQQAMRFGASGYLFKQSSTTLLAGGIREAVKGNAYFSPSIPKKLRDQSQKVFSKNELKKRAS
jgi:DNA-binding NarL/FixJ family response regulator